MSEMLNCVWWRHVLTTHTQIHTYSVATGWWTHSWVHRLPVSLLGRTATGFCPIVLTWSQDRCMDIHEMDLMIFFEWSGNRLLQQYQWHSTSARIKTNIYPTLSNFYKKSVYLNMFHRAFIRVWSLFYCKGWI